MFLAESSKRSRQTDNSGPGLLKRKLSLTCKIELAGRRFCITRMFVAVVATLFLSLPAAAQIKLPVNPKPSIRLWCVLTGLSIAASAADIHYTLALRRTGGYETDPIMKPFFRLPAPAYTALGLSATAAMDLGCLKLKRSPHVWIRRFWWAPQVIQIWANARGAKFSATE